MQSKKTEVVEILFEDIWPENQNEPNRIPMTVSFEDVAAAIRERNARHPEEKKPLSDKNPANFLKDMLRSAARNENWPAGLKRRRITARQRYGENLILEFVPYTQDQQEPFPEPFAPPANLKAYPVEALSITRAARELGRSDEAWLTQVLVSQRIINSHFAFSSPLKMLEVSHLQMSVKTQPEIDAMFLGIFDYKDQEVSALITVEAKGYGEPILENQVREQCAQAFELCSRMPERNLDAVIPMAVKVMEHNVDGESRRGIYVCEIEMFLRERFEAVANEASIYEMPFDAVATSFFYLHPPIKGISFR